MSKYTTEVRFICESYAGLTEQGDYNDVDTVVTNAIPKIFDVDNIPVEVPEHKTLLFKKILLHYYQREIGFETVGLWKLYLNNKLKEIMPYYNQLYRSELLQYDPLQNVSNTHRHTGSYVDNSKVDNKKDTTDTETRNLTTVDNGSSSFDHDEDVTLRHSKTTSRGNDTLTHSVTKDLDHWTLYSDTPQGGINGVQNGGGTSQNGTLSDNAYLTNATHVTESPSETQDVTAFGTITETYNNGQDKKDHTDALGWDKTDNTNTHTGTVGTVAQVIDDNRKKDDGSDEYTNIESGKIGVETYQEMVIKYRETFLNIDMMIIDELSDLFMKVW